MPLVKRQVTGAINVGAGECGRGVLREESLQDGDGSLAAQPYRLRWRGSTCEPELSAVGARAEMAAACSAASPSARTMALPALARCSLGLVSIWLCSPPKPSIVPKVTPGT